MENVAEQDRAMLVALLDRTLRVEGRTAMPPHVESGDWLCDSAELSAPDGNGWMTCVPTARKWVPRALIFWRMAVLEGTLVTDEQMCDPRHSLARWPMIEAVVGHMLAAHGSQTV